MDHFHRQGQQQQQQQHQWQWHQWQQQRQPCYYHPQRHAIRPRPFALTSGNRNQQHVLHPSAAGGSGSDSGRPDDRQWKPARYDADASNYDDGSSEEQQQQELEMFPHRTSTSSHGHTQHRPRPAFFHALPQRPPTLPPLPSPAPAAAAAPATAAVSAYRGNDGKEFNSHARHALPPPSHTQPPSSRPHAHPHARPCPRPRPRPRPRTCNNHSTRRGGPHPLLRLFPPYSTSSLPHHRVPSSAPAEPLATSPSPPPLKDSSPPSIMPMSSLAHALGPPPLPIDSCSVLPTPVLCPPPPPPAYKWPEELAMVRQDYEHDILMTWRCAEQRRQDMFASRSLKSPLARARCRHIDNLLRTETTTARMSCMAESIQLSLILLDKLMALGLAKTAAEVHIYGWITFIISLKFLSPRVSATLPHLSTLHQYASRDHLRKIAAGKDLSTALCRMEKMALQALGFDISLHTPDTLFQWWCSIDKSVPPPIKCAISYMTWIMIANNFATTPSHTLRVAIDTTYRLLGAGKCPPPETMELAMPAHQLCSATQMLLAALQCPPKDLRDLYATGEFFEVSTLISQNLHFTPPMSPLPSSAYLSSGYEDGALALTSSVCLTQATTPISLPPIVLPSPLPLPPPPPPPAPMLTPPGDDAEDAALYPPPRLTLSNIAYVATFAAPQHAVPTANRHWPYVEQRALKREPPSFYGYHRMHPYRYHPYPAAQPPPQPPSWPSRPPRVMQV